MDKGRNNMSSALKIAEGVLYANSKIIFENLRNYCFFKKIN